MRAASFVLAAAVLLGTACPEPKGTTLWLALGQTGFSLQDREPPPY